LNLDKESDAGEWRRSIGQIRYIRYVGSHWADTRWPKGGRNTERELSAFHSRPWHVCRHDPHIGI